MSKQNIIKNIISDLRVELSDEFDRNFERKAFFDRPWPKRKRCAWITLNKFGTLEAKSPLFDQRHIFKMDFGHPLCRNTQRGRRHKDNTTHAQVLWAMYYKSIGGLTYNRRTKKVAVGRHNTKLTADALFWRNMALTKKSKITMPQRQFIGYHDHVGEVTDKVVKENIEAFLKNIKP